MNDESNAIRMKGRLAGMSLVPWREWLDEDRTEKDIHGKWVKKVDQLIRREPKP